MGRGMGCGMGCNVAYDWCCNVFRLRLCHWVIWKRHLSPRPPGQSISPNGGNPLYIENREMSDKLRNDL